MKLEQQVCSLDLAKRLKRCPSCGLEKLMSEFHPRKKYRWPSEAVHAYCKPCNVSRNRKYLVARRLKMRTWRIGNPETVRMRRKRYNDGLRIDALNAYSNGNPVCVCCGETEPKFLAIDHINGNGSQHRRAIGKINICFWLKKNSYPSGFQILCHNCNMAKAYWKECPHAIRATSLVA